MLLLVYLGSYYCLLVLLVLFQFQIAPVLDRRTNKAWIWSWDASRRQLEHHLPKASDRWSGVQRLLRGQRVVGSHGTDKPKWRQNCSIGAFRQSIDPSYLWFLKGPRYLLTLWANYSKQENWKSLARWTKTLELYIVIWSRGTDNPKWREAVILWHRQAHVKGSCFIGTFRKPVEQTYLWLLKDLRYLLTLWIHYSKQ